METCCWQLYLITYTNSHILTRSLFIPQPPCNFRYLATNRVARFFITGLPDFIFFRFISIKITRATDKSPKPHNLCREIDWCYFRNLTTDRVARSCVTGLPDIHSFQCISIKMVIGTSKLVLTHFFKVEKSISDVFDTCDSQGCQILRYRGARYAFFNEWLATMQ